MGAVAATAGCTMETVRRDIHGFDVQLLRSAPPPAQEVAVWVQLKSTTTIKPDPNKELFSYKLKKRAYFDRLAAPRKAPKAILVVMACSPVQEKWTACDHDQMSLQHCSYWVSLEGDTSTAEKTPTVHIPTANVFDADALTRIMDKLDRGEALR